MRAPLIFRQRIITLRSLGLSFKKISKRLESEGLMISCVSIYKICKKYDKTKFLPDFQRSGRKAIFKQIHYELLNELISNNRDITSQEIAIKFYTKFSIKVSQDTIVRAAKRIKWSRKSTRYCQIVSDKKAIKRYLYANICFFVCDNFFDCIFIDESLIELELHTVRNWVKEGSRYYKAPVAKHPLKLLLWAGISCRGATPVCIFQGKMNSAGFIKILDRNLVPFIHNVFPDGHRLIMDNDRKHVSKETQKWLGENRINHWPTPAQRLKPY
ncbi:unnamed protein product [Brachionus calyciflorus]|uniref:Tc1-like transposase DDE domain-containing protein n=1 Tax=Brachionus calyciflorus TaxID=104777 RepID=A0A813UC45_9BILA|nr:unnamed protein product [Brachionus calyciflorus]